ncbi:MAG: hypothetical protein ACI35W_01730 [Anaeroplasmataceae bacterium]
MKNDNIEMAYEFDPMDDSMNLYENKMISIIEARLQVIKNLNSHEWNDFSNSCFEIFKAYQYLTEALIKTGRMSSAIRYSKDALEYCQIYRQYVDSKSLKFFSEFFSKVIKDYGV